MSDSVKKTVRELLKHNKIIEHERDEARAALARANEKLEALGLEKVEEGAEKADAKESAEEKGAEEAVGEGAETMDQGADDENVLGSEEDPEKKTNNARAEHSNNNTVLAFQKAKSAVDRRSASMRRSWCCSCATTTRASLRVRRRHSRRFKGDTIR
jgi:hypothetical protein